MRGATCFSGIGAPECAMPWVDWRWSADVEAFPNAVRAERFPDVPNLGNVLADEFLDRARALGPLDMLVGGPPCQDFSTAGLRAGLNGHRGNLTLRWVQIIHAIRPVWAVTENVPGWLSVNDGHAFGAFLAGLVGHDTALVPPKRAGGRWTRAGMVDGPAGRAAWRILDAQYFGLAQRRNRVFVVSSFDRGADPAAILFERQGVRGHSPPRRKAREGDTGAVEACAKQCCARPGAVNRHDIMPTMTARTGCGTDGSGMDEYCVPTLANPLGAKRDGGWRGDLDNDTYVTHPLLGRSYSASEDGCGRGTPIVPVYAIQEGASRENTESGPSGCGWGENVAFTLEARTPQSVAFDTTQITSRTNRSNPQPGDPCHTLSASADAPAIVGSTVRRLMPVECERLQGFPDSWTDVPFRGKPAVDGPRYRAIGNSMAVPVLAWIGRRILAAKHGNA